MLGKHNMKRALLLFIVTIFVVACSRDTEKDSNHPQMESNNSLTESTVKGIPPMPATKGLYDFSECKAKFKVGTEDYKGCVKAKYPNVKFAGEER